MKSNSKLIITAFICLYIHFLSYLCTYIYVYKKIASKSKRSLIAPLIIVVQSGEVKISIEDGNYFQMSKIVKEGEVIYSKLAVINYMLNFKSKFYSV